MPKCKNDPKKNYNGEEPSPKGLGYCAGGMKLGTKMEGNDGLEWIVKETLMNSKTCSEWIKKNILIKDLKKRLKEEDVYLFVEKDFGNYGMNYFWDGVREKLGPRYMDKKFIIIIVGCISKKHSVIIQHNNIIRNTKKKLIEIFENIFKNKFVWDGKQNHSMILKV